MSRPAEMTVEAIAEKTEAVTEFINSTLRSFGCPTSDMRKIDIAVDELFSNIVYYAYPGESGGFVTVRVERWLDIGMVRISFMDHGKPFDPLSSEDPDTDLSTEERKEGGLGIYLVKKMMDDVRYCFCNGQNILTISKKTSFADPGGHLV